MKLKVAVLFGGKSTEHEVSIISAIQVLNALDKQKYELIPIYISKNGDWILGDKSFFDPKTFKKIDLLVEKKKFVVITNSGNIIKPGHLTLFKSLVVDKIDIVFPVFHGKNGEDGTIQGLFEIYGIPYVGCGVSASAVAMDKVLSKHIASKINIPTMGYKWFSSYLWKKDRKKILSEIIKKFSFPLFVKSARLGSSIGLSKVNSKSELESALEVGYYYDTKVMVEQYLHDAIEINISLMGNHAPFQFSSPEQPIKSDEILSFTDKYLGSTKVKGMASSKRILPARIKKETLQTIQKYSADFFTEIGGKGFARLDFLLSSDEKKVYFNEINTIPGSVAFYLWKDIGMSFQNLLDHLIKLAIDDFEENSKLTHSFSSNILEGFEGTKNSKN